MSSAKYSLHPPARVSTPAVLAIACSFGSILASCSAHQVIGLILALLSLPIGILGIVISASPSIRGGWISFAAIGFGILGVVVSIVAMVTRIVLFSL